MTLTIKRTCTTLIWLSLGAMVCFNPEFQAAAQIKDKLKKIPIVPKVVQPALPTTLHLVSAPPGSKNSSLTLHQVKYGGAAMFGRPVAGSADVALTLLGHSLPVLKNQKFTGTVVDKSGRTSGIQITLSEDLAAGHFLGSKVDLVLEKGSQIVTGPASNKGVTTHFFQGSVRLRLPYTTESGKPAEVHLGKGPGRKPVVIPLDDAAFAVSDQNVPLAPTTFLVDGVKFPGVSSIGSIRFQAHPRQSRPFDLDLKLGKTRVIAYLPRFLLKHGVIVYANKVDLDHSSSTFSATSLFEAQKLECIRPAGFELQCQGGISITVVQGETTYARVEGTLQMPACLVNCPAGPKAEFWESAAPVKVAARLTYSTKGRPHWTTAGSGGFTLAWHRFGLAVKDGSQYALSFDGPGGLRVTGGTFFAGAFTTKSGDPLSIPLKTPDEFFLQTQGVAGQITLTSDNLKGMVFPGTLDPMIFTDPTRTLHFGQGQLTKVEHFRGNFGFKDIVGLPPAITLSVSPTGEDSNSFDAKALAGANVSFPDHGVRFHISQGSLSSGGDVSSPSDYPTSTYPAQKSINLKSP